MGEAFGEQLREAIRQLYAVRLRSALLQANEQGRRDATEADLLRIALASHRITSDFDPETAEEMEGIARGSGLDVEQVMAMNGMTDLRDALSWWEGAELFGGCTAILAQRDVTSDGTLLAGQTWDLGTDNMPFVVAVRRAPTAGPRSICLTTVGCLPFLGVNEHGLVAGTTNLRTRDARPGVVYVSVIDQALRSKRVAEAIERVGMSPRSGAHFFYLADAEGSAAALECTARRLDRLDVVGGAFVHTNHCLVPEHVSMDVDAASASSEARRARMTALAENRRGSLDVCALKSFFADCDGGPLSICRDDIEGTSTNAAAILCPEKRSLIACHGLPTSAPWVELCA